MGLTRTLERALTQTVNEPWLPSVTGQLVKDAEARLLKPMGLDLETYSTSRYLRRTSDYDLDLVDYRPMVSIDMPSIECLDENARGPYEALGIRFCPREQISFATCRMIDAVFLKLKTVPNLYRSILKLVKTVHVLNASDDSYDISHSDPMLPFSIFFSVPQQESEVNILRAMESIVHEAMHLQLTLIEHYIRFALNPKEVAYSPWMCQERPISGVIHGVYVFSAVHNLYQKLLLDNTISEIQRTYILRRNFLIENELETANSGINDTALSKMGLVFRNQTCSI